jgi:hypothetical protein
MTRSLVVVSKRSKELYTALSSVAVVADAVVIDLIIASPRSDYPSLLSYSGWSLISKYNTAEVKSKSIANLVPVRVVFKSLLESLAAL